VSRSTAGDAARVAGSVPRHRPRAIGRAPGRRRCAARGKREGKVTRRRPIHL